MTKSTKLLTPLLTYPPSRNRLLIIDWGSLAYHQLFALSAIKRVPNPTYVMNNAQDEIFAWKTKMMREILDMVKLFNPLDILIALEGRHTWRHGFMSDYYKTNVIISYNKNGFFVSYDNDIIKVYKSGDSILSVKMEDKDDPEIPNKDRDGDKYKEIEYEKLPPHVKVEVDNVLPKYKGSRTKRGWDFFMSKHEFNLLRDSFAAEVSKIFRAHCIFIDRAEGDDIIYVTAKTQEKKYESMILVSRDSDLYQLLTIENLVIYNHMDKDLRDCKNPMEYLDIKVLAGDTSDSIPGILLPSKKKKLGEAGATTFYESMIGQDMVKKAKSEGWLNQYMRNRSLIDLSLVPPDIEREIAESIENSKPVMCPFHEIEMMDMTPKIIKEISKMKDLGYYSLNTQKMIDMNPHAFDPNRSEIRAYGSPEKSGVVKRFDNTSNYILE